MQPGVLRALEFDKIVEAVKGFALTPMGAERLARLHPSAESHEVAECLAGTTETSRYLRDNGLFPIRATDELPQVLSVVAVEGSALGPPALLALAAFLDSTDDTRTAIRRAAGSFPRLIAASNLAASFKSETADV